MTQPTENHSWKGLFGCLGGGILFLALIGGIIWFVVRKNQDKEIRITREFLQPWFEAARDGNLNRAWETLTTETYRTKNAQAAVAATWREAAEKLGPPRSAVILKATGAKKLLSDRPGYQIAGTKWTFGEGKELFLVFELLDVPGQGFRVDHARLGFTRRTGNTGYLPPAGTPEGPW